MNLSAIQSHQDRFSILELDHSLDLAQKLELDLNFKSGLEQFQLILRDLITHLALYPSAVAAEPIHSLPLLLKDIEQGLILRLDQDTVQRQLEIPPRLSSSWGVDEVVNNYAVAKLDLWYHPAAETALKKKKLVAELYDYCSHSGTQLFLKLNIAVQPDESKDKVVFQEAQLQAVQELRSDCHLLALEYPHDALSAATLTAELDHPWIVTLTASDHQTTKQQLRTALENGAAGFISGQALWSQLNTFRQADKTLDLSAIQNYIETSVRDQMIELVRITDEVK